MKNKTTLIQIAAYTLIFFGVWIGLAVFPPRGGYFWDPWFINFSTSLLFTLFVFLTARLARTDQTIVGIVATAIFIVLFCPGEKEFFSRDEGGLVALSSQCIVPFFISQYNRTSQKNFGRWYFLMLLMGIFCSYTHNGITVPLCGAFLWLAFQRHERFFRQACWPMVVGFVIGTALAVYQRWDDSVTMTTDPTVMVSVTSIVLQTLWETKVFVLSIMFSIYIWMMKDGRKQFSYIVRRHYVIALCVFLSLITIPFAPLGITNAVTGVCFFSMFWLLYLSQYLAVKYLKRKI